MEMEHHQWSANNLGVDRQNLTRREEVLGDRVDNLHLLWHLLNPERNHQAKALLKTKRLVNDVGLMLTAIATGDSKHLEHLERFPVSTACDIVQQMRNKIKQSGVPIQELSFLQALELLNEVHNEVLNDTEETFFGEED